jgi:hypothetical protein
MRPANGSAIVFQTNVAYGPDSDAFTPRGLVPCDAGKIAMRRRRHVIDDRVEQRLQADRVQARRAEQREDLAGHGGRAQS